MIKIVLIVLAVALIGLLTVVALQPPDFRIARTLRMASPPQAVFNEVNDLHRWEAWSPWAKLDPDMKQTYEGPPAGAGASSAWTGNKEVGEGRMTISESRSPEFIRVQLEFLKPFKAVNQAEFTFKPEGEQTVVSWSMTGQKNFMVKAVHLFMDMDKMIGGQFEQGLAQLKAVVEAPVRKTPQAAALPGPAAQASPEVRSQ